MYFKYINTNNTIFQMKKKIFCTRKKFIDQIKSWCYHTINNFFSWSRKILLLTFLYIKPYLIYYAKILATIFFLIKKKKLYGRRYKHIFYCLADIDCILVDLNPVWIVFNNYILLLSFYYIYCIPLLYYFLAPLIKFSGVRIYYILLQLKN